VTETPRYDVAIVGGGQSGLAIGYLLGQQGLRSVILEAAPTVGVAWQERWDSLTLFTPRRYDALPGSSFPGDPDGHPTRDEVVAYLERYVDEHDLPVRLDARVQRLRRPEDAYVLALADEEVLADQVVIATGAFQVPSVPPFADRLAPGVVQMHSTGYRRPTDIPPGTVAVLGGGTTGDQNAAELAATHDVHLAVGSRQKPLPQRLLGRDIFWWLTKLGILGKTVDSRLGKKLRDRDTLIGSSPRSLRKLGVTLRPRASGSSGQTVEFADGTTVEADAVIWATGYRPDHSWIELPLTDANGALRHRRGVTEHEGLYFLGQPWQYTRGSALLGWVKDDAAYIAEQITLRASAS
jgi:putative flavoprotein involved in K+ transport